MDDAANLDELGPLPVFVSRKRVRAARIAVRPFTKHGRPTVRDERGRALVNVIGAGGTLVQVPLSAEAENRLALDQPQRGDVLVIYPDGYLSWLPAAKFEEPGAYEAAA